MPLRKTPGTVDNLSLRGSPLRSFPFQSDNRRDAFIQTGGTLWNGNACFDRASGINRGRRASGCASRVPGVRSACGFSTNSINRPSCYLPLAIMKSIFITYFAGLLAAGCQTGNPRRRSCCRKHPVRYPVGGRRGFDRLRRFARAQSDSKKSARRDAEPVDSG